MTSRLMYEALLIELNKTDAPNILLEDFNYFANKAINQYINKRYNIYDVNQQTTDDLRVLKATAVLPVTQVNSTLYEGLTTVGDGKGLATYEAILPSDYLHILNCICIYNVERTFKCYNKGNKWRAAAKRLTADAYSLVLDNFWNRPTYKRPYYYIHNVNTILENKYNSVSNYPEEIEDPVKITNQYVPTNINTDSNIIIQSDYIKYPKIIFLYTSVFKFSYQYNNIDDSGNIIYWYGTEENKSVLTLTKTANENKFDYILDKAPGNFNWLELLGTIEKEDSLPEWKFLDNTNQGFHFNEVSELSSNNFDNFGNLIVNTSATGKFSYLSISGLKNISNIERGSQIRYGNASQVRMEIRYGTDNSVFRLEKVLVDYIKAPQNIRLTQEQLDLTEDSSQMLEYPDYVCQEIINELVHIVMENIGDPKLQTHPIVSLSIANPAQQLTEPVAQPATT